MNSAGEPSLTHPNDHHVFDLLGVGAREDSYTDVLAAACVASHELAAVIAAHAEHPGADAWRVVTRTAISHEFDTATVRSIPDLVLVAADGQGMVLIENKILSGEGHRQTERYIEAVEKLAARLDVPSPTDANTRYLYLTLDGGSAADPRWRALAWTDLVRDITKQVATGAIENPKLALLLDELCERIDWRATITPPPSTSLRSFLTNPISGPGWSSILDTTLRFHRAFPPAIFDGFTTGYWTTANRGYGTIPIVQALRPTWQSATTIDERTPDHESLGTLTYNVHFELQWQGDRLALMLHHETNPYRMRKEVASRPALVAGIKARRRAFATSITNVLDDAPGWSRDRSLKWNNMLSYAPRDDERLSIDRPTHDLQAEVRAATQSLAPLVEHALAESAHTAEA